ICRNVQRLFCKQLGGKERNALKICRSANYFKRAKSSRRNGWFRTMLLWVWVYTKTGGGSSVADCNPFFPLFSGKYAVTVFPVLAASFRAWVMRCFTIVFVNFEFPGVPEPASI